MYCFVSAICMNSRMTADVAASSMFERRLISVDSVSISSSFRFLKILADTSAPRLARRIAALRRPESVSISAAIATDSRGHQPALLQHPGAQQLCRHLGLGVGQADGLLAQGLALAADLGE